MEGPNSGLKLSMSYQQHYHPELNGHAECAVKEMKHLLGKTKNFQDFRVALREWRNTPRFDGLSPAQWLFGRRQRTDTPASSKAYQRISDQQLEAFEARRGEKIERKLAQKDLASKPLDPLRPGDAVYVQDPKSGRWDATGEIIKKRGRRSYVVEVEGKTGL